ncbi:bifunctional adenosylcobinamide kinase/adenosylcobinamide-phosphate guanylyltransferase [Sulfurospirillum barnesii]|uniref:Adenosylcobinamide kinase n=1 Tax=Sulfurospirillum barnesii (strain ATCC 700032 / DSM 10660 / SES-3) TaxID=760154 RepID=I3XZN6_SULBS|nr:bifunctional adenosylcobinamide kinase/adenosylcobinamide-phosphate guanylyltransferase [Sulfurospirillum barnesii]AFL69410.1 adenosyl cobinamide kinase/adenosyl cobinamide phosphate guanylyltransferase [Sulfurospirillum barnesii SES-3]
MKILYFGGQRSGKSALAEAKALSIATSTPYYIATYDASYGDTQMHERIALHRQNRLQRFITLESPLNLASLIQENHTYLIDCLSMWILNHTKSDISLLMAELTALKQSHANIIFVLNDVNSGVAPIDSFSRHYIDTCGTIGQYIASFCDEVYEVKLGIGVKLK